MMMGDLSNFGNFGKFANFGTKGGGKQGRVNDKGDPATLIWIRGPAWKTQWQDLKDHLKQAGTVEFVKMFTEDGTEHGRKKGTACARYSTAAEAKKAVKMLNKKDLGGRYLEVDHWTSKEE